MVPEEAGRWVFPPNQIAGLIPFAYTQEEDLWCWFPAMANSQEHCPIVFCPNEDEVAVRYADNFAAFCYRRLLEEYACTGLTEHVSTERSQAVLDDYRQLIAGQLSEAWNQRLADLAQRPWEQDANGYCGCITEDECADMLAVDMADPRLDEEFEHYIE